MQKRSQGSRRQERGKKEDTGTIEKMDSRVRNYPWSLAFLWKTQVWKSVLCDAVNLKNTVHYLSVFLTQTPQLHTHPPTGPALLTQNFKALRHLPPLPSPGPDSQNVSNTPLIGNVSCWLRGNMV